MSGLDSARLSLVFQARPDILAGIQRAADSPDRVALFNDIANFVYDQLHSSEEPLSKRRRTDTPSAVAATNGASGESATVVAEPVQLEIKEISLSIPVRKKLDLCFTASGIYGRASGSTEPVPGSVFQWKDFEFAFYLPVPEKNQVQHNYILMPRGSSFTPKGATAPDPLVFTVNAGAPKPDTIAGPKAASAHSFSTDYHALFDWAFASFLRAAGSTVQIVASNPARFHSVVKQSHRPNEKAVHIKAFRGSKEGYLFFLATGILWGFKKPLLFIPLERIAAVSYTSVLQRTFNMVVEVFNEEATEEIEFSMIDQQDYQGIDERYVKKNGLQDRSMAEQRKAKLQLAENIKAAKSEPKAEEDEDIEMEEVADDGQGGPDVKNMSALERAEWEEEKRLQDAEDEEEEDYNPGSDGDSDGSGSSSEEESDGEGGEAEEEEEDDDEEEEDVKEEDDENEDIKQEEEEPQLPAKAPAPRIGGWAALNR
ncbi:hypothetical protein TD95_001346 [Thielaviopsis punctulata]|uniref:Histone chaperone RTT106/FACT complex subunit SPT16-like middle domain-containing protein n=1 Tax=Thielaviopsis punctulata TaxID=72032 RepID=A0A0F4ZHK4_9PEZI|nr:hypothetical protein TD95_001346 [Thielaviopsis punctulata]